MAAKSLVSQQLKTFQEELSASRKERAASTAGASPEDVVGANAERPEGNELHDQFRQLVDELRGLFDGADKRIASHPTRSVVGAMLIGILIGRLLGRR